MRKQLEVPGTERPHGEPDLDAAALQFKRASKRRKKAQDDELASRDFLENLMRHHKLKVYENLDAKLLVTLESTEKVKVDDVLEAGEEPAEDGEPDEVPENSGAQKAKKKSAPAEA